jgi:hypothetical protein
MEYSRNKLPFGLPIGIIFLLLVSFCSYNFIFLQFGGYDLSPIIDLTWRLSNNEVPGKDFISTFPLGFLLTIKAISWGSLGWGDLTIANIAIVFITFFAIVLLDLQTEKKRSIEWYLSVASILSLPLLYTNHIWHSSFSQYFAIVFFYSIYILINSNYFSKKILFNIFIASALVSLTKQNVAVPCLIMGSSYLLFFDKRKLHAIVVLVGALTGISIALFILHVSLSSFLYSYSAVLGRSKLNIDMWLAMLHVKSHWPLLILLSLYLILFKLSVNKESKRVKSYFLIFLLISLLPILTNWDIKINDSMLPIFIFFTGIFNAGNIPVYQDYIKSSRQILFCLLILSLLGGYCRERMKHVGPFYEIPANSIIHSGYFKGLVTGLTFEGTLDEIRRLKNKWPEKIIYFGPRIEFAYLETKSKSPKGFPLWIHPGTSYALFDERNVILNFVNQQFDILVFVKGDRTRMPPEILSHINEKYHYEMGYRYIDVYLKNNF